MSRHKHPTGQRRAYREGPRRPPCFLPHPPERQQAMTEPPAEAHAFREAVYAATHRIPPGQVASYGAVAAMAGRPLAARAVGAALKALPPDTEVPWHRVINAQGKVSPRGAAQALGASCQRARLEAEGHRFDPEGRLLGLGKRGRP